MRVIISAINTRSMINGEASRESSQTLNILVLSVRTQLRNALETYEIVW